MKEGGNSHGKGRGWQVREALRPEELGTEEMNKGWCDQHLDSEEERPR